MILCDECKAQQLICLIPEVPFIEVVKMETSPAFQQAEIQLKSHLHTGPW